MDFSYDNGKVGLVTPFVWMTIQSYEKLRNEIINNYYISSLVKPSYTAFFESAIVSLCSYCIEKHNDIHNSPYFDLGYLGGAEEQEPRFLEGIHNHSKGCYFYRNQNNFKKLPGCIIAYNISDKFISLFDGAEHVEDYGDFTGSQHITADNEKYLRFHREIKRSEKWKQYSKGGDFRKWYGNIIHVVKRDDGALRFYKNNSTSNLLDSKYLDREGITYSAISAYGTGFRFFEGGAFDKGGPEICINKDIYKIIALLNSNIMKFYLKVVNPTMNTQVKDIKNFPIVGINKFALDNLSKDNVQISKEDWDSYDISLNFKKHPFLKFDNILLSEVFSEREKYTKNNFKKMKENEIAINKEFLKLYGLSDEIDDDVIDRDITLNIANRNIDSKSFLSYIVGCMLGRYSIDEEGLIYDGGDFDPSKYKTFEADDDGIIPVLYDSYFVDDVVDRTKEFVKKVWGEENFDENRVWLAQSIDEGSSKSADEIIRNYYNKSFMEDHFNTYKYRPIYRYFVSNSKKPKESAFKCIVYLHRYNKDTISIIRSKYLYKFQSKLEEELARLSKEDSRTAEKRCDEIRKELLELGDYDKRLKDFADKNIELDLDDGVKVNYTKLMDAGIVAKLKI